MAVPLGQEKSQGNGSGHVPWKSNFDERIHDVDVEKKRQNFLHFDGKMHSRSIRVMIAYFKSAGILSTLMMGSL